MKILSSALCAVALLGVTAIASTPATARPLHVIVRGATPIEPETASPYDYSPTYGADNPYFEYGDNFGIYDWPAGRIPDSGYYGPPAVDLVLARTLDRNHESILGHMLRCEASYATYNPATNFYWGAHGQPMTCYR